MSNPVKRNWDVVITGGGLAGLTLARQLRRRLPHLSILVVERHSFPVPEAAFKVGESTVEIGAHYFGEVLGLREHLEERHLPKHGLRYFFTADGNHDIARRVELGPAEVPVVPSYQIDRGRLENELVVLNRTDGIEIQEGCRVEDVSVNPGAHRVRYTRDGETSEVEARWLVDASGRAGLLKRQLSLARGTDHAVNAAWFRLSTTITIDDWSTAGDWRGYMHTGARWLSTNHLMGRGYWVWLIPLGSGSISVGIVADPAVHPLAAYNRFDRALGWLRAYEPQVAEHVERLQGGLEDFRVLRHFSHGCTRVFSGDQGWFISGEAGVFTDPLYSPGSDFIAIGNDFITELIARAEAGESIAATAEHYNRMHLLLFQAYLHVYTGQYPIMGSAQVMTAKVLWDFAAYWAITAQIYFRRRYTDLTLMRQVEPLLQRFFLLHARVQRSLRQWYERMPEGGDEARIDLLRLPFLSAWQRELTHPREGALENVLAENFAGLEALAAALQHMAERQPGDAPAGDQRMLDEVTEVIGLGGWAPARREHGLSGGQM